MIRLAPWLRRWCALLAAVASIISWNLHADERPFVGAPYEAVRHIAHLEVWATAWGLVAVVALLAASTGRVWAWRVAGIGAMLVASTWATGLLIARVQGVTISMVGLSLWWWLVGTQAIAMSDHGQFETYERT